MNHPTAAADLCAGVQPDGEPCQNRAWSDGLCAFCFMTRTQQEGRVSGGGELHHAQVRRCTYKWMPTPKPGSKFMDWRPCNGAVLAPARLCHKHGGNLETDLGRIYAEAIHAAQTGRLTLPSPAWWQAPQRRWETLSGRGVALFSMYPDAWAETWNLMPESWMRVGDRVAALAHYLGSGLDEGYGEDELIGHVIAQAAQPHLAPRQWANLNRYPAAEASGLPTTRKVLTEAVAVDSSWTETQAWGAVATSAGRSVPVLLFAANETEGGPHRPVAPHPPGRPAPQFDLDGVEACLHNAARTRRWTLEVGIARPEHGVAHFDRERHVATVFHGVGDRAIRLWALAHTAGHLALGHGECGDDRTLPHEAEAEAFAIMALHRAGVFDQAAAATWRAIYPVDLSMLAFDRLRAATAAANWLI